MLGLRTVIYKVGDTTEWYSKAFKTAPYFNEPFYVGFNIGSFELGLQPKENPTTEKPESVTVLWGVNDVRSKYKPPLELGAASFEELTSVGGNLMVASVEDPRGNILARIYNPEFKTLS